MNGPLHRIGQWCHRYWRRRRQGFGVLDAARLASGRPSSAREEVWDVPFWLSGRMIATVRVPAASEEGAITYAGIYLHANLYPHKVGKSAEPLPRGGREIVLPERAPEVTSGDPQ
jgi:hypothetical protein